MSVWSKLNVLCLSVAHLSSTARVQWLSLSDLWACLNEDVKNINMTVTYV